MIVMLIVAVVTIIIIIIITTIRHIIFCHMPFCGLHNKRRNSALQH